MLLPALATKSGTSAELQKKPPEVARRLMRLPALAGSYRRGRTPKPFFVSDTGKRPDDCSARYNFATVCQRIGLRTPAKVQQAWARPAHPRSAPHLRGTDDCELVPLGQRPRTGDDRLILGVRCGAATNASANAMALLVDLGLPLSSSNLPGWYKLPSPRTPSSHPS
jgi:hypothetical protein